ncbi:MAG: tetratricopeptide repeat protein [Fidelibacterota bacterium]
MRTIIQWIAKILVISLLAGVMPVQTDLAAQTKKKRTSTKKKAPKKSSKNKRIAQANALVKRGISKAKKKDYNGALKDLIRAYKLNPSKTTKKRILQLQAYIKKTSKAKKTTLAKKKPTRAKVPALDKIPGINTVDYANQLYSITEAFEISSRELARATSFLEPAAVKKVTRIESRRARTLEDLEQAARVEPNDFRLQVELARQYEAENQPETAKDIYLRLVAQNPFNADAHFHLGSFFARVGQLNKARDAFEEALDVQPDHQATIEAMATYFGTEKMESMSREVLTNSARKRPEGAAHRLNEIRQKLEAGEFEAAIRMAGSGREKFPNHSGFVLLQGKALEGLGETDQAKTAYQTAVKMDPNQGDYYIALAKLYFDQGKYIYAGLSYSDAVRVNPTDSDARFLQGLSYFKAREWGRAAQAWEDLLHFMPQHKQVRQFLPQAYYILAVEYNRHGEPGLSQTSFRKAMTINQNSGQWLPSAMLTLGNYYREQGKYQEALSAFNEVIELKPYNSEAYLGLGIIYWKMKEPGMAKAAWQRSMELDPKNNDARGWLLLVGKTD